jgi:hypothetical protein
MRSKPLIATAPSSKTDELINELHLWAVHEGLRRTPTATLFEDFCRRLIAAGVPLWRAFAGMRTLHPQWASYTYTWWRDRDSTRPSENAAKSMSGTYGIAPMRICAMSPLDETCRCAYGVG